MEVEEKSELKKLKEFISLNYLSEETRVVLEEWLLELEGVNILNLFNGEHSRKLIDKVRSSDTEDRINLRASIEISTIFDYFLSSEMSFVVRFLSKWNDSFKYSDEETYEVVCEGLPIDCLKWHDIVLSIALLRKILK